MLIISVILTKQQQQYQTHSNYYAPGTGSGILHIVTNLVFTKTLIRQALLLLHYYCCYFTGQETGSESPQSCSQECCNLAPESLYLNCLLSCLSPTRNYSSHNTSVKVNIASLACICLQILVFCLSRTAPIPWEYSHMSALSLILLRHNIPKFLYFFFVVKLISQTFNHFGCSLQVSQNMLQLVLSALFHFSKHIWLLEEEGFCMVQG